MRKDDFMGKLNLPKMEIEYLSHNFCAIIVLYRVQEFLITLTSSTTVIMVDPSKKSITSHYLFCIDF